MIVIEPEQIQGADFLAGVTLLVDKPLNWTSFDVVNKIRFLLRKKLDIKKIKVGHAGTLDPLATGLLIIAIGADTKKINDYQEQDKRYSGILRLGATTPSYDSEFEPDYFFETSHITPEMMEKTRLAFIGEILQVPPVFSALKVQGERAYKRARKGEVPVMEARKVRINDFTLDYSAFPDLSFSVYCQKGTYIRSLAHDYGKAMESGAYLLSLKREGIGYYDLKDAIDITTLTGLLEN